MLPRQKGQAYCDTHQFLEAVDRARAAGRGRASLSKMPLDVHGQAVGRLVAARAVLLQALHHDPIEVAAQAGESASSGSACRCCAMVVSSASSIVLKRVEGRSGSFSRIVRRISSRPACKQFLRVEGRLAGEQFVEQHAQRVDVAARIDVQAAHLRLLRAHVGGVPMNCSNAVKSVLSVSRCSVRFGDAEIDDLRHGHAVVQGHQDVRRLDVAVDDALLMRVLDGLADLR